MAAIKGTARLRLPAGKAAPSPAIGQALGPLGLNMMEFCKEFNARTGHIRENTPVPVRLTAFANRTFTFETRTPPTTWLLKRVAGIGKGAASPGKEAVGYVTVKEVFEIAKIKQQDEHMKATPLDSIAKSVVGTARTMGLDVVRDHEGAA